MTRPSARAKRSPADSSAGTSAFGSARPAGSRLSSTVTATSVSRLGAPSGASTVRCSPTSFCTPPRRAAHAPSTPRARYPPTGQLRPSANQVRGRGPSIQPSEAIFFTSENGFSTIPSARSFVECSVAPSCGVSHRKPRLPSELSRFDARTCGCSRNSDGENSTPRPCQLSRECGTRTAKARQQALG